MKIINSLFKNKEEKQQKNKIVWSKISRMDQLEDLFNASDDKPIAIFKHSTRCGISSMVLKRFENQPKEVTDTVDFYYLDLLMYRQISDEIADKLQVMHESPQVIVLKDKRVVAHASHYGILQLKI